MNSTTKNKPIRVKIDTTFSIGDTAAFHSQFDQNGDLILELEPGTTVEELLRHLPGFGCPENWSDLFSMCLSITRWPPSTGFWKTRTSWIFISL